jgi:hypothetical protein
MAPQYAKSAVRPVKVEEILPKQVKVGPYTFQINARGRSWFRDTESYGQMVASELEIDIVIHPKPIVVLDTLIHEIFHAIWYVSHLQEKDDDEERIVCTMATAWTAVLRDNPDLLVFQNEVMQDYHQ